MAHLPEVISTVSEMIQWRRENKRSLGFVPTMGALHEGHATLLRKIRPRVEVSALSIFVNPTQFGPKEDLSRYPRTFENDLKIAAQEGVDIVFAPSPEEIYPAGFSTYVEETRLSQNLCGKFRPVFFRGITTVVLKLFNIVRPELALFGLKDAQQFFVLEKMTRDLHMDIKLEGISTVREFDGLALSSRNAYLTPEERTKAPLLYRSLSLLQSTLTQRINNDGSLSTALLSKFMENSKAELNQQGFQVQYLECMSLPHFDTSSPLQMNQPVLIAVAAFLGTTRLIDNVILSQKELSKFGVQVEQA